MGAQFYDLKQVQVWVREVRVEGFAPNDAIGVEWNDDLVVVDTTADGQKVVSRTNDAGMDIVFNLMNTSEAYRRLALLMAEQYGLGSPVAPTRILPMPFRLYDPTIGDLITDQYFVFKNRPAPVKGRQASVVQFRGLLPNPTIQYGVLNVRLIP